MDNSDDFDGATAIATGWGLTKPAKDKNPRPSHYLMEVNLTVINNTRCRKLQQPRPAQNINDEMICALSVHAKGVNRVS